MTTTAMTAPTLADSIWPSAQKTTSERIARAVLLVSIGSLLIAISSKIQVPFYPVPMTLQTMVILAIGMAYGPRLGVATVVAYLVEGAAGLPVFAGTPEKGIGLVYMMGGTGGYLAGYVLAVSICGLGAVRGWDRSIAKTTVIMLVANAVIYVPGCYGSEL